MQKAALALLIGSSIQLTAHPLMGESPLSNECAFCRPTVLTAQTFYEDECVRALYTHKPITPAHILVIPKRHVERFEELSEEEISAIGATLKRVNELANKVFGTSSYLILQKNGRECGQTVPHVHFHYIGKRSGDDSVLLFMARMLIANLKQPISNELMQQRVTALRLESMAQGDKSRATSCHDGAGTQGFFEGFELRL